MKLCPANLEELRRQLGELRRTGGRVSEICLEAMDGLKGHQPEDMTITVEAGMTLRRLQERAGATRQWLPVDPPQPERCTIGALIATNASGSRRYAYGPIREHLIGLAVVLADGRCIRSGGRVVKNVAGYDLQKLFVGSRGSLGVIVEATFKLLPLPECEQLVQVRCRSLAEAATLLERIMEERLEPVMLDLHNAQETNAPPGLALVLGFAGTPEFVERELARAGRIGRIEPLEGNHQERFWADPAPTRMRSVLPSRTVEALSQMGSVSWLAHAGNGVIYYREGEPPPRPVLPWKLLRRIKEAFDPENLFCEPPGMEGNGTAA